MHLVNNKKVIGIPKLSGEPQPICGECMKGKGSISILGYPKLDGVLYVDGLKLLRML